MFTFSIPVALGLTKESSWHKLDDKGTQFAIVRTHFRLDRNPTSQPLKLGEVIAVYEKPETATMEISSTTEEMVERVVTHKSLRKHLVTHKSVHEVLTGLTKEVGIAALLKLDASVKSRIVGEISTSFTNETSIESRLRTTRVEKVTTKTNLPPHMDEPMARVAVYKEVAYDVILTYIDYLRVDYERSLFGLRRKARRLPLVTNSQRHDNRVRFGIPVGTAFTWESLPYSCTLVPASQHKVEVLDPHEIRLGAPKHQTPQRVEFPSDVPTLYQIARATFPRKWIWRKVDNSGLSNADLMRIEDEEVAKSLSRKRRAR